jgi:hypothetical protein
MRKGWTTVATIAFFCSRKDGRALLVQLHPEPGLLDAWTMLAIETCGLERSTLNDILDDHAHERVSSDHTFVGLADAMKAAERYAKKWQRRAIAIDPCACGDIGVSASQASTQGRGGGDAGEDNAQHEHRTETRRTG